MRLTINGELVNLTESIQTVTDMLDHFGLLGKVVIVEINGLIIDRNSHSESLVSDGDRIEIVHFVGGG